jgi:hypothetical protein
VNTQTTFKLLKPLTTIHHLLIAQVMNTISNFGRHLAIPAAFVLAANFNAQAQKPVESTHVDEKYAYTTVVYKNTAATDKDVLTSLENDFSVGDVVRVTLAPPPTAPTAPEPVYADLSKGEDTWLPEKNIVVENLTATTSPKIERRGPINVVEPNPAPIAEPISNLAPKTETVAPVTASENAPKASNTTVNTQSATSAKAHKSVKKSARKGGPKMKLKNRRPGKQRYACPKF